MFSADELGAIRAMITAGGSRLGGDIMDLLPKLGAIVCYGTGYDGVDLKAAAARNIAVGHSPGANASSVADIAVTLMLASVRRLLVADDYVRDGSWAALKAVAADAAASRHARPQGRRLRHGRDRPQDRRARRGLRERGRLFQPQPPRRAVSLFRQPRGARRLVQRADDRGARRPRDRITSSMPISCGGSARTAMSSTSRAARSSTSRRWSQR